MVYGTCELIERGRSSTWRELKAMFNVLNSLEGNLKRKVVKWYTDNDLHTMALSINDLCREDNIQITVVWIPRELNAEADLKSKLVVKDD